MDDENFKKVMSYLDPKRTGAIPRTPDYSTQFVPSFYWDLIDKINQGLRVCVILRGLPGSGKSFLGKKIIEDSVKQNPAEHIISADDYFIKNGKYQYDVSKISDAHQYAQKLFFTRASKGYSPLIVDNTHVQCWEMAPYAQGAIQYFYHLEIMEPQTPWKFVPRTLALKNKHNVPMDKIKRMLDNYDRVTSAKHFADAILNLCLVEKPKIRDIPPYKPMKPDANQNSMISTDVNNEREPLSWQAFNKELQKQNGTSGGKVDKKQNEAESNWNPPPQIFEEKWDQPSPKEITIKEKEIDEKPQSQRKQRKSKKPSSPENELLKPHRKNCPNENPNFAQIRELYPDIKDNCLWDFFEKCNGDAEWCADMLCDENLTNQMDTGEDLTCTCSSSDGYSSASTTKIGSTSNNDNNNNNGNNNNVGHNKKQTPVKAKKVKSNTDELLARKIALEENVRIREEFYPEHVNRVKAWKGITPQVPQSSQAEENQTERNESDDTLVALSVDEGLIKELNVLFGGGEEIMKELLENRTVENKMFIKSSTAKQLYQEILETCHSHREEAKLKKIESDRYYALMLHEQEKAYKYPNLVGEKPGNNFKDIMDTQAALKEYEEDVGEWQKVEKPETISAKLNKEKLYKVFSSIDREMIDQIFEAQDRNLKKTVEMIEDSLDFSPDQRKLVAQVLEHTVKFTKEASVEEEDDFTPEEYACIKRVEDLQEQFDHHSEEQMRCIQKSKEHQAKKEFHTASYYTSMVALHKQLSEEKRQELMNILSFSFLNNPSSTRLDLHYFTQEPAKTRLHTFLDTHIAKLREIKKQYVDLEIITGRGAHSSGGPVLKNMTIRLFQERGLRYTEGNPGLLKVKVYPNSVLYDENQQRLKSEN